MFKVLIADDDVDAWFRLNALMRLYMVKASVVINLAAARQFIEQQAPALLFFDTHLQDKNTPDFIRYVKTKYPDVKIIMVDTAGLPPANLASGADLVISKPFIPEIIERIIKKLLPSAPGNT